MSDVGLVSDGRYQQHARFAHHCCLAILRRCRVTYRGTCTIQTEFYTSSTSMREEARLTKFLSDDELYELISAFPAVEFAFAYGSGVVQQQVRNITLQALI